MDKHNRDHKKNNDNKDKDEEKAVDKNPQYKPEKESADNADRKKA